MNERILINRKLFACAICRTAKRSLFFLRTLITLLLIISATGGRLPAQGVNKRAQTMRSLDDLREFLINHEVFPVDFTATVTYYDWERRKLFVQGEEEAIFISAARPTPEQRERIRFGSRLRVTGKLPSAHGAVRPDTLTVLDGEKAVEPLAVEVPKLKKGAYWSRYVQLRGELIRVVQSNLRAQLVIRDGETKTVCFVPGAMSDDPPDWSIGSQIQVEGVLDWATHSSGAPRHALCHVTDRRKVTVISDSKNQDEDSITLDSLSHIKDIEDGARVKVAGVVTFLTKGEGFLLEDDDNEVFVRYEGSEMFSFGDNLLIDGTPVRTESDVELSLNTANRIESRRKPRPPAWTTARQIVADNKYNRRVMLSGKLVDVRSIGREHELLLMSSGFQFRVNFLASKERFKALDLKEESQLACRGLVRLAPNVDDVWFTCEVHSNSIWNQENPAFIDRQLATMLGLGVLGLSSLAGLWLFTMRLQVKRKTRHLADVTAKLQASHQATREGVLVLDTDGRVANVNSKFGDISGLRLRVGDQAGDLVSRLCSRFESPERVSNLSEELQRDELVEPFQADVVCPNTGLSAVFYASPIEDERGQPIGRLITLQDVTRQKELERHLLQSQKMEAVGRLAGGIAHDFNNLLQVMDFNVSLAKSAINTAPDEATECMESAELAVRGAARLVNNLLGLSRRSTLELKIGSLNGSVERVVQLIRRTFPSTIEIETDVQDGLSACRIDENQIDQVLINVCLNARDAISNSEGKITLSTSEVSTPEGDFVRLSISDNGQGMDRETLLHIFEPFYTTKPTGEGTGLGMSMSYGIVQQLDGRIWCDSQVGVGTGITIELPAVEPPSKEELQLAVKKTAKPDEFAGRLLVVDDEDAVRNATAKMASILGWDVVEADGGEAALELVREAEFSLVLLDYNMPGMSGKEVLHELSEMNPDLPVIMCTGYAHDVVEVKDEIARKPRFLQKPFRSSDLKAACEGAIANVRKC